jgi:hypothetical protein
MKIFATTRAERYALWWLYLMLTLVCGLLWGWRALY